jgi:hypothetical protein
MFVIPSIMEFSGIADIKGVYGVVLYLNEEDCKKVMVILDV